MKRCIVFVWFDKCVVNADTNPYYWLGCRKQHTFCDMCSKLDTFMSTKMQFLTPQYDSAPICVHGTFYVSKKNLFCLLGVQQFVCDAPCECPVGVRALRQKKLGLIVQHVKNFILTESEKHVWAFVYAFSNLFGERVIMLFRQKDFNINRYIGGLSLD